MLIIHNFKTGKRKTFKETTIYFARKPDPTKQKS